MRAYIQIMIGLVFVFLWSALVPRCEGYGGGFCLEYSYGELNLEDTADKAIHNSSGLGVMFETNVSRRMIFNYRLGLGGAFHDLNHYRYDHNWWEWYYRYPDRKRPVKMFYDDEGWGLTMTHSFLFALVRRENLRISLGPSIKFGYTEFSGQESPAWIYRTTGAGYEVVVAYHVDEKKSLSFILDYYTDGNTTPDINTHSEEVISFKLALVFRSKDERNPPAAEFSETSQPNQILVP